MNEAAPAPGPDVEAPTAFRKATVNDIARVAGVSLATVDRVLNARPGVRNGTIERVNSAIAELGYIRDRGAANLARKRSYTLLFLLPEWGNEFFSALRAEIEQRQRTSVHERTNLLVETTPPGDPQKLCDRLDQLSVKDIDGVALFGPEIPSVRDAINRLRDRGVAVATLLSDIPSSQRDHFVGIDNVAAGRTAASLMGRFVGNQTGSILVIVRSRLARDHLERRGGFDAVMAESFPQLEVLPTVETLDSGARLDQVLPEIMAQRPSIVGLYSTSVGHPRLAAFLAEQQKKLGVIVHELTASSRLALDNGLFDAVISQDCGHVIRSAIRQLRATADKAPIDRTMERIRIDIYMKENLPPAGQSNGEIP